MGLDGCTPEVLSVTVTSHDRAVHNLTLDGSHNFLVTTTGILVHNTPMQLNPIPTAGARRGGVGLISDQRRTHILFGDSTGGGHMHPGRPGKSVFPADWDEGKIINHVEDIATDPSISLVPSTRPGRFSATGSREGQVITVILEPDGEGIITAWPGPP